MKTKIIYITLLISVIVFHVQAQEISHPFSRGKLKHRLSIGIIKSFYQNDPNLTTNTKSKAGFNAVYKAEFFLGRRTNLVVGLEYQNTGLTFDGYYYKPGYTNVYDGTYPYSHDINIQELQLPLQIKYAFNSEKEHFNTPYFIGGIAARYIFNSYTVITNDSTGLTPFDSKTNVEFENQLLIDGLNALFQLGLGLQHNKRHTAKAYFFEINYKYNISRLHYEGNKDSNNLNIRDSQLIFTFGLRL